MLLVRDVRQDGWNNGEWPNAPSGSKQLGLWRIARSKAEQADRAAHAWTMLLTQLMEPGKLLMEFFTVAANFFASSWDCLLYTSPSPRD